LWARFEQQLFFFTRRGEKKHAKENQKRIGAGYCGRELQGCCEYSMLFPVSIRQHTSAYVSIRQHTSAYVSIGSALALDIAGENCKVVAYLVCGTSRGSEKENAK
jgi:hypothetical protein